ncbi:MAG: VTT domain-containing protein, partial [Acidimicrobiia bacterium]|nr:VTT domain-containing protein [Acidimicrobiia bacterium]
MDTSSRIRLAVLAAVVIVVAVLGIVGAFDPLFDQDRIEELLDDSGPWGPLIYIAGFSALQPLSAPGAVLVIPATFVWSAPRVFILSWLGGILASTIGFALARFVGRDWVESRLPDRFRTWDDRIARRGFLATVGLRLLTGLAPPADWALGVSRVQWPSFLAGTAIGLAPGIAALAWLGDDAIRLVDRAPLVLAAVGVLGGLGYV